MFYGCSNYPNCDFVTWDEPLKEQCPQCGKSLFKKRAGLIYCPGEGCGYERKVQKKKRVNLLMNNSITVIGAGLAGCEAAWQIAGRGIPVTLIEMKPKSYTPAHHNPNFAELVCSNSLKAQRVDSAAGLLKEEMRRMGSVCMLSADECSVAAGGALAVDREAFAEGITKRIKEHPLIDVVCDCVEEIPQDGITVIATGPLTQGKLAESIKQLCGDALSFYDAAAPIVTAESVDMSKAFTASRYEYENDGEGDYINCPMNKEEYEAFYEALMSAEKAPLKEFDKNPGVYEGCMPVEVMGARGADTLRFGPMKPVGLRDPRTGHRPWAVLQLRKENRAGSLYNLVGFQTNLKFGEQKRVFSMIPALHDAEFMRYGVMHRNSFIDSPRLLQKDYSLRSRPDLFFAGQLTGVEGYMESASSGILAGINAARRLCGKKGVAPSPLTMTGALVNYICDESVKKFQPMGANFGVLPPLGKKIRDKRERYQALADRALKDFEEFLSEIK